MTTAVAAMGGAVSDNGWTPLPQRLTTTFATAAARGDSRNTIEAVTVCCPPRAARSSEKITRTPRESDQNSGSRCGLNALPRQREVGQPCDHQGKRGEQNGGQARRHPLLCPVDDAVGQRERQSGVDGSQDPSSTIPIRPHPEGSSYRQKNDGRDAESDRYSGERRQTPQADADHCPGGTPDQDQHRQGGVGEGT